MLQAHAWGEFKRQLGWTPLRLVMWDPDLGDPRSNPAIAPRGTAQILAYPTPLGGRRLLYCPKGPWLHWSDPWELAVFFSGMERAARHHGDFLLRLEPEVLVGDDIGRDHLRDFAIKRARWELQYKSSWIVDLAPSEEDILAAMKPKTRYNIKYAARKGVTVSDETDSLPFGDFYALYQQTATRDAFPIRPYRYVAGAWQAMRDAGLGRLFVARYQGQMMAALVAYTLGTKCWYMYGASQTEGRNLMPAHVLQWEVMRWAKGQGATLYDMLAIPTAEHRQEGDPWWGLYRFKSGFGGYPLDTVGSLELAYNRPLTRAWRRIEPAYYRWHLAMHGDVYY